MVGEDSTVGIVIRFIFLLAIPDLIYSFSYPVPVTKRFTRTMHLPMYIPDPVTATQRFTAYQSPEYDNYVPVQQTENAYNVYEKYPVVPVYSYYPPAERHDSETYGYVEEEPNDDQIFQEERSRESSYPYGQETYFEGGNGNAEANAVFLQNLIFDQMYRDAATRFPQNKYSAYEDESDRHWSYGIPVTEVDYSEGSETEDESVKQLESLREQEELSKDGIFRNVHVQKKKDGNSRKNRVSVDYAKNNHFDKARNVDEKEKRNKIEVKTKELSASTVLPSTEKQVSPGKPAISGQKEYVLPRPANPVRRPFERAERASVYNTIKRLLSMEDQEKKKAVPRIQKRFVLNDDQLTSQLSGLKKMAV